MRERGTNWFAGLSPLARLLWLLAALQLVLYAIARAL
jgi:hypothetical protein